ncbi:hypothetical protein SAMN05421676_108124 [Salinibacillus kushneri]|uniref:Uncharacterized protein n=2 Tax=Salinibacillus kushneri TaxID=237682 RepID=A0A1I0H9L8_9BACI|nr:hypothetical protein SAMN05421676_108124 [Salinibacillus kushneri]
MRNALIYLLAVFAAGIWGLIIFLVFTTNGEHPNHYAVLHETITVESQEKKVITEYSRSVFQESDKESSSAEQRYMLTDSWVADHSLDQTVSIDDLLKKLE